MTRLFLLVVVAVSAVVLPAGPAEAHAVLRASQPEDRQVMPRAPERVVLRFSESVAVSNNSVRILGHHGDTIVGRGARHVRGEDAQVELRLPELEGGVYVVAWRVVSADSHPAAGAFSFRVGEAIDDFHVGAGILEPPEGDRTVGVVFGVVRFAVFSSVILLAGSVVFLVFLWPSGRHLRRPRRLVGAAWVAAAVATVGAVALQGAYVAGEGLGMAASPSVIGEVLDNRYGVVSLARLALLAAAALLVRLLRDRAEQRQRPEIATPVAVFALVALLLSVTAVGHASTGRYVPAAMVLDLLHLFSVSAWLGGLVMLVAFVLPRSEGGPAEDVHHVVARFSRVAFAAVVVMVVTGTLQGWRQLDGLGALGSTTYGRLLLAKLALVAAVLVAARFSRRLVRSRLSHPVAALSMGPGATALSPSDPLPRLRKSVAVEVAIAVVVIAVTTGLTNADPARDASKVQGALPFSTQLVKEGVKISVTVEPAAMGLNDLHVYSSSADGRTLSPLEVSATMTLAAEETGPLKVALVENGTGHWSAFGFSIPLAGTWDLDVGVLVTEIDLVRFRTEVPVR